MPRPAIEVDTAQLAYDLDTSPRSSLSTIDQLKLENSTPPQQPQPQPQAPTPSIRLLFSLVSNRLLLLLPAICLSLVAGGVAPFMTYVIGQVFDAFARFPLTSNPPQSAKDQLLHDVGMSALELIGLAVGSIALGSITSSIWIRIGEHNVMALRKRVYTAVSQKDMAWFDTNMGDSQDSESSPNGAGGLMAKFTRDTDDVRTATSLASGMLVQYFTTCITCLILAFTRSWALTLVILSAVPVLIFIQFFSQAAAGPLLSSERSLTATAGTLLERAVSAIATVKAFNAAHFEQTVLDAAFTRINRNDRKLSALWGFTCSMSQFATLAMFVQGFWFGSKLVRDGSITPGDVMAVFWACLMATSNIQLAIPQLIDITKGKFAIVDLLSLADNATTPTPQNSHRSRSFHLRKIVPRKCYGELSLHNVTFSYPSRPTIPVLDDVSLYLPGNEMTFIVGGSGSGKSTIAQLLLRMYTPQSGFIQLDDQDITFLDEDWSRQHVACVSQGCILFDMSIHDNVAMGVVGSGSDPAQVTRDQVVEACTASLMHEFIRELPEGYETKLGTGGANLSGGQRQRLAIARAQLRNPPVLILDEATSALDPTSRILVFEAIRRWRSNKTTVVITHDLSQISAQDFVYVLKDGHVVEQGYRNDLETLNGEFRSMMLTQQSTGGCLPVKEIDGQITTDEVEGILETANDSMASRQALPFGFTPEPVSPYASRRLTLSNWMFDAVVDLTTRRDIATEGPVSHPQEQVAEFTTEIKRLRRPSSIQVLPTLPPPVVSRTSLGRPQSLLFTPTSPVFPTRRSSWDEEKAVMEDSATHANSHRLTTRRTSWKEHRRPLVPDVKVVKQQEEENVTESNQLTFFQLIRELYPTIPYKPLVCVGIVLCLLNGAMTPLFSFLLSRLLYEVSIGAQDVRIINIFGGVVLSVAALDGILLGTKFALMESCGMTWITRLRKLACRLVLAQDKKWFDKSDNSPARLVQVLLKDGDDARNLLSTVLGQCLVVFAMLSVGLIWALAQGWQLTLVGFAIGPVFAATMSIQSRLISNCQLRNKRAREDVAKSYYETISNIRGIRSMTLGKAFQDQFDDSAERALSTGLRGSFVEGCSLGVASGLIYLAEALLFYVGAVLISRGTYTYLQMVQVLNLVVFTVTLASQLMAFTTKITNSVQAAKDLHRLVTLSGDTDERKGTSTPAINGDISFQNVNFTYPTRPDVPVLRDFNLSLRDGECVAIVGSSGSGKSTVTSLLQRLYRPDEGTVKLGAENLQSIEVEHLRSQISVVSQNPHLFNATISENVVYGDRNISEIDVRKSAKTAHAHEFIMALPQGYDTSIGENASQISGGQAQRLALARAFARPSKIMILDECTSALDPSSESAILDSIWRCRAGRTIIMVTHKLPIMQQCDRIIVLDGGRVAEQGSYDELMDRKGIFASLAHGGEWE